MDDLFGRYCYIDTPWIAGKKTRYRIIGSGVRSNAWCEVPVTGRTELVHHDNTEEVVFVVLDTHVSDDSIIRRFALKDVDVMPSDVRPVVRGRWEEVEVTWLADVEDQPDAIASMFCSECRRFANHVYHYGDPRYGMNFCPHCGARMGGDAK